MPAFNCIVLNARPIRRLVLIVATFMTVVLLVSASPADAHPIVVRTFPQAGYSVAEGPAQIGLKFDERVTAQSLTLDGKSRGRIATSQPSQSADGMTVTVSANRPLPDGTYTVRWRITAADGDVVDGTFGFGVGVPTDFTDAGSAATAAAATTTALRWLLFAGLALALGSLVGDAIARDRARRAREQRGLDLPIPRPWVLGGSAVGLVAVAGLAMVQVGGGDLSAGATDFSLDELTASSTGRLLLVESVGLLLAVMSRWRIPRSAAFVGLAAVIVAEALRSHLTARLGWVGALTIGVHLAVASLWFGAITHLVRVAWWWRVHRRQVVAIFRRYARFALIGYVLVVATGTVSAIALVPSLGALTSTGYGRFLLFKLTAVTLVTALALAARRGIHRPMSTYHWRGLRFARFERVALAVVLIGSAGLTATSPSPASSASSFPPPVAEPAVYVGGLAGQVATGLIASGGSLQVRLNVPEAGTDRPPSFRLHGVTDPPTGRTSTLSFRACGPGCFTAKHPWTKGETKIRLSIQARGWTGDRLDLVVPWPAPDGRRIFERALRVMSEQRVVRIGEEVTSNSRRPEGMSSRLRVSGDELLDAQPYRSGIVSNVSVLAVADGRTDIGFALTAESIYVRMSVDRAGRIQTEQILSRAHLITRTYGYPSQR